MLLSIEYRIERIDGEYHAYVIMEGAATVLHSSYHYRPCWEVVECAKKMQQLASIKGNV